MLVFEVILSVLAAVGAVALVLGWLFRPLWRALAHRWRIEGQAARIRVGLEREQSERQQEQRGQAAAEVAKWLNFPETAQGAVTTAGGLAGTIDPVLSAVLERHPLDDRVLELNRLYRQATGKDLLPARLLRAAGEAGSSAAALGPQKSAPAALSGQEAEMVREASREVEAWLRVSEAPSDLEVKREDKE